MYLPYILSNAFHAKALQLKSNKQTLLFYLLVWVKNNVVVQKTHTSACVDRLIFDIRICYFHKAQKKYNRFILSSFNVNFAENWYEINTFNDFAVTHE